MLSLAKRKQHLLLPSLTNSIDNTFTSHGASSEALNRLHIYLPVLLDHAEGAQQTSVPRLREAGAAASASRLWTMIWARFGFCRSALKSYEQSGSAKITSKFIFDPGMSTLLVWLPVSQVTVQAYGQQATSACAEHVAGCDLDTSPYHFGRDFGGFLTSEKLRNRSSLEKPQMQEGPKTHLWFRLSLDLCEPPSLFCWGSMNFNRKTPVYRDASQKDQKIDNNNKNNKKKRKYQLCKTKTSQCKASGRWPSVAPTEGRVLGMMPWPRAGLGRNPSALLLHAIVESIITPYLLIPDAPTHPAPKSSQRASRWSVGWVWVTAWP